MSVLVLGSVLMVAILQVALATSRIQTAATTATVAAEAGAHAGSQFGGALMSRRIALDLAPGSEVIAHRAGETIEVTVRIPVDLFGPDGPFGVTVERSASNPISPFRSRSTGEQG